jgi:hypothetical protein
MKKKNYHRNSRKEKKMLLNQSSQESVQPRVSQSPQSIVDYDIHLMIMHLNDQAVKAHNQLIASCPSSISDHVASNKPKRSIWRRIADIFMGQISHVKEENHSL